MKNSLPTRHTAIDAMKWVAACGIVWIHTVGSYDSGFSWTSLGRFGVPFFTIVAMYFATRAAGKQNSPDWSSYAYKRFIRLYVPFLIWNIIYTFFRLLKNHALGFTSDIPVFTGLGWFLGSTAVQLWFLPFLLICNLVFFPLAKWLVISGTRQRIGIIVLITAGFTSAYGPRLWEIETGDLSLNSFIMFSYDALPSALIGCAWGLWNPQPHKSNISALLMLIGLISLSVGMGLMMQRWILLETLAGIFAFVFCLFVMDDKWISFLAWLGKYSMGVYLIHPLVLDGLRVGLKFGGISFGNLWILLCLWLAATWISWGICVTLSLFAPGRRISSHLAISSN